MTENYAVENTGSYGGTGLVLGGLAGAGAGWGVAAKKPEWVPKFLQTQKYKSLEDIIREKKDTFVSSANKEGIAEEEKNAWKALLKAKDDYAAKIRELAPSAKFNSEVEAEGNAVIEAKGKLKEVYKEAVDKLVAEGKTAKEAKKFIKDKIGTDESLISVKDARDAVKNAANDLAQKAKSKGVAAHKEIDANTLKPIKDDLWAKVKDEAAKIKGVNKTWTIAAAAVALGIVGGLIGSMVKSKNE